MKTWLARTVPRILLVLIVLVISNVALVSLIPKAARAAPANAYWVGDGGNWSDAATHWAAASGGAPGAGNLPDATTTVHFDASSFTMAGQVVTNDSGFTVHSMDWTGATNNPTFAGAQDNGIDHNLTTIAAMTWSSSGWIVAGSTGGNFTTNGLVLNSPLYIANAGTVTLQDNFNNGTRFIRLEEGGFNTNGHTVTTTANFSITSANAKTLTLGASVINVGSWGYTGSNLTLNENTSSIRSSGDFAGGGETYNDVRLVGATSIVTGSNTFASLLLNSAIAQTITFTDGTTQTSTAFTLSGTAGNVHTLQGSGVAGWNITKAGGGTVVHNYVAVDRSTGNPAATWTYHSSTSTVTNSNGWTNLDTTPTVTTQAATGVAMTAAGVTSGTFNGTITGLGGYPSATGWFEYGLTIAYGSSTANQVGLGVGAFTAAIPNNLTPGATYHYRARASNALGSVNGVDQSFTFTMPTVTTGAGTYPGGSTVTLAGTVGSMGVASTANYFTQYGTTSGSYTNTSDDIIAATGGYTDTVTAPNESVRLYFRSGVRVGTVYVYGTESSVAIPSAAGGAVLRLLLRVTLAGVIVVGVLVAGTSNPRIMLVASVVGLVAFIIIDYLIGII